MRPQSIVMFERLFLLSLALSLVGFAVSYQAAVDLLARDAAAQQLGMGGGFVLVTAAVGYALYLGLWYLIARKAANWAKWVLVVLVALGVISLRAVFSGSWGLTTFMNLAVYALEVAAVVYLFRADAKAWLNGEEAASPATFE